MFAVLGRFASRFRYLILVVWIAAAAIITIVAPNIDEVSTSDQAAFLPANAPHVQADKVYKDAFPATFAPGSTWIVIDAQAVGGVRNPDAATFEEQWNTPTGVFISQLATWLQSEEAPKNIVSVVAPTMSPLIQSLSTSKDNRVAALRVDLSTSNSEPETADAIAGIDSWIAKHKPGQLVSYQTGSSPIITDTVKAVNSSLDTTLWVTIVLVVLILLAVYRSPVSPLIPLMAVTVAYLITRGIVGYLGANVMTITSYANIILIVVLYGAGTDYCMFLISRFREEMAGGEGHAQAAARTVHGVGETIASSAGTVFVGFMSMIFAEMGLFNTSGPALAIGIVMSLLAGLTFTPALLAVLGPKAFWPGKASHRGTGRFYEFISNAVSRKPVIVILAIIVITVPVAAYGLSRSANYDMVADLPRESDSVKGFEVLRESLGAGQAMPLTLVVTNRDQDTIASDIMGLTEKVAAVPGVADIRSLNDPLGRNDTQLRDLMRVDVQLGLAAQTIQAMPASSTGLQSANMQKAMGAVSGLKSYLDELATRWPQVAQDPNLLSLKQLLANPTTLLSQMDKLGQGFAGLAARFSPSHPDPIKDAYIMPTALSNLANLIPNGSAGASSLGQVSSTYLSQDGRSFKMDVVLGMQPTGSDAMNVVADIRDILKEYEGPGEAVASGGTAVLTDIRDTMDRDLLRTIGFVLAGIYVVLFLMLRSVFVPLYLMASVVLTYGFTTGISNLVFSNLLGANGLTWYVQFFAFVLLVALGVDYSIFLTGRIKEEVPKFGIREGVHKAVQATGGIILSCGVILAGTFAALLTGQIRGIVEIGFIVAVGVLTYTVIVMPMFVPSFAVLLGQWAWWPGNLHLNGKSGNGDKAKETCAASSSKQGDS